VNPLLSLRRTGRGGVLGERNFRLFLFGYGTSLVGSAMVPIALTFAVLNEGRGTSVVGYVLAAETIPLVALLLAGGVLADRFERRAMMLAADLARLVSEGLLAALLLTGTPPLWVLMALAGVLGAGQALFNPAMSALVTELVLADRLQQANGLRSVATSTAQILGPSLAGVIVAVGGPGWAIAIDAATYAVSAVCLLALDLATRAPADQASMLRQLVAGWNEFRSRTWLWLIVAQFALVNALAFVPLMVLGAVVARDRLGGAAAWGAILAAFGVGSILGGLAALRLRPRRPLVTATLGAAAFALPPLLTALPADTALIAGAAGAAGIGLSIFNTLWVTTLQRKVPAVALSRVSAYDNFGSVAFVPLGYILVAPLAGTFGVRGTLFLGAAIVVATSAIVLTSRSVRMLSVTDLMPPRGPGRLSPQPSPPPGQTPPRAPARPSRPHSPNPGQTSPRTIAIRRSSTAPRLTLMPSCSYSLVTQGRSPRIATAVRSESSRSTYMSPK
jgi:MFS family permease